MKGKKEKNEVRGLCEGRMKMMKGHDVQCLKKGYVKIERQVDDTRVDGDGHNPPEGAQDQRGA